MSGQFGPTRASDNIRPPVAGEVTVFAVSGTAIVQPVPTSWRFRYVTIQAETADVYILFGPTNSVNADPNATTGDDQCVYIPAGGAMECYIPGATDSTVQFFSAAGTVAGKIRCWPSSPAEGGSP